MKKISIPILAVYALIGVFIFVTGGSIVYLIENSNHNKISIDPTIIVKDSTSVALLKSYTEKDVSYLIENSIENIVDKEFDRSINYLNFTMVFFGIFLTLILVIFGFFTLSKMQEAKEQLDKILAAPDTVMKKYHEDQLNNLVPLLTSPNPRIKADTVQKLSSNTQIVEDKHYDLLAKVLKDEFDNVTSFTLSNVFNLFDILSRMNYSKTISLGYDIFEKNYNHRSMEYVAQQLVESPEQKHKNRFVDIICNSADDKCISTLIDYTAGQSNIDNNMLTLILDNAESRASNHILSLIIISTKTIDLKPIILNTTKLRYVRFSIILDLVKQNNQYDYEIIAHMIRSVIKNDKLEEDHIVYMIRRIYHHVNNAPDLLNLILLLKEQVEAKNEFDFNKAITSMGKENEHRLQIILDKILDLN